MYKLIPFHSTIDTVIPSLFSNSFMSEFFDTAAPAMRVDVCERENAYIIEAELPGVKKEQIGLTAENGMLTISAEIGSEKKEQRQGYLRTERRSGHVERSFSLEGVDANRIKASYENGVLNVLLPKEKPNEKNAVRIEIGDRIEKLTDGE